MAVMLASGKAIMSNNKQHNSTCVERKYNKDKHGHRKCLGGSTGICHEERGRDGGEGRRWEDQEGYDRLLE